MRDPRAIAVTAVILSVAFLVASPRRAAWLLAPAVVLAAVVLDRRGVWALAKTVGMLWILTVFANAAFAGGERWGPEAMGLFRPSIQGVRAGLVQGVRLAGLAAVAAWAVRRIDAVDLAASVEWTVRGIPAVRRWVHQGALPVVLALRVLPLLVEEAARLVDVERLRSRSTGRWARMRSLIAMAPVWMVSVIDRAEDLALAMTLRGYDPHTPRGFVRAYRFGAVDVAMLAAALAAVWLVSL